VELEIQRATEVNEGNLTLGHPAPQERSFALIATAGLSLVFVLVVSVSGGDYRMIALFPIIGLLLLLQVRFEVSLAALVVCLFVDVHLSMFSSAVVYSIVVGIAFVLRYRDIDGRALSNPMTVPIVVYGLSIIPSFLNAAEPLLSAYKLINVVAFLIALYVIVAALRSYDDLRRLLAVYVAGAAINAVFVIIEAMQGVGRPFGPAGIMFGDYAGLGVCVMLVLTVQLRGRERVITGCITMLLAIALVLTQIRNAWMATLGTLAICGVYIVIKSSLLGLSRKSVIRTGLVAALVILSVSVAVIAFAPQVGQRATSLVGQNATDVDENGLVHNSLISRVFIWDVAFSAFRAHPLIGIGVYGFPYASASYTRLPTAMYEFYIARNSPHQTHIAVLSETGILGAIGFLVFLVAGIRSAFRGIRMSRDARGRRYAVVALTAFMYIVVSMAFTDAWLWGQGIVLMGLSLGAVLALGKMNSPFREFGVRA
jgi:O-antigen ligase